MDCGEADFDDAELALFESWLQAGKLPPPGLRGKAARRAARTRSARPDPHSSYRARFPSGAVLHLNLCQHGYAGGPSELSPELVAGVIAAGDVPLVVGPLRDCELGGRVADACASPAVLRAADAHPGLLREVVRAAAAQAAMEAGVPDAGEEADISRLASDSVGGGPQLMVFECEEGDEQPASGPRPEAGPPAAAATAAGSPAAAAGAAPAAAAAVGVLRPDGERGADGRPAQMVGLVRVPKGASPAHVDVSTRGLRLAVLHRGEVVWSCRLRWPVRDEGSTAWLRPRRGLLRLALRTREPTAGELSEREAEAAAGDADLEARAERLRRRLAEARDRRAARPPG